MSRGWASYAARKAGPAPARRVGLLERKCACGGACESCRKGRDHASRQHVSPESGRDFSQVPVRAPEAGRGLAQELTLPKGSGVIGGPTYESSDTCEVGRSESNCFPDAGAYLIGIIANDCCTRPCTVEHEMQHVRDMGACCSAYAKALKRPGADALRLTEAWSVWKEQARPITECRAYTNDITCAQKLAQLQGCAPENRRPAKSGVLASDEGPSGDASESATAQKALPKERKPPRGTSALSACCIDIAWYEQAFRDEAEKACSSARGNPMPPCPFTTKGTP